MVFCVFRVSHFFSLSDSLLRARENKQIQSQQGKEFAHHLKLIFLVIEKKELLFSLCFLLFLSLSPPLPPRAGQRTSHRLPAPLGAFGAAPSMYGSRED